MTETLNGSQALGSHLQNIKNHILKLKNREIWEFHPQFLMNLCMERCQQIEHFKVQVQELFQFFS
jgi:hypothetical protein